MVQIKNCKTNGQGIFFKISYTLFLILSDLVAFYTSLLFSFIIRKYLVTHIVPHAPVFEHTLFYYFSLWWLPLCFILFFAIEGLYTGKFSFWEELRHIWKAVLIASIVALSAITLQKLGVRISRTVLITCFLLNFFTIPFFRSWTKRILFKLISMQEPIIIIGAGRSGTAVARGFLKDKNYHYKIIGFLDDFKTKNITIEDKTFPILGKVHELDKIVSRYNVQTIVLAMPSSGSDRIKQLFNKIKHYVPNILIVPELQGISLITSELDYLFYEEIFLIYTKNNLSSPTNRFLKRISDFILIIPILLVGIPVMILIALIIKLTSPGPIIYSQNRIGQNGRPFKIYKFRTMYNDADKILDELIAKDPNVKKEWESNFKLKNDPRITKIGYFLRKTSLDELPQIFNVLKGDMSLVGPRPVTKFELEKYYREDARFYKMIKPGITGLWQVSGRSDTSYEFRKRMDVWYVQNWCLWLDIVILLQTIKVVIKMEGAY